MAKKQDLGKQKKIETPPLALPHVFGYMLAIAARRVRESLDQSLAPLEIIAPQLGVLFLLNDHGPLSQIVIGNTMSIDRASMVKLIDNLEDKKIVARRADPTDRRANLIELTKVGRTVLAKGVALQRKTEKQYLSMFSEAEAKTMKALLARLIVN